MLVNSKVVLYNISFTPNFRICRQELSSQHLTFRNCVLSILGNGRWRADLLSRRLFQTRLLLANRMAHVTMIYRQCNRLNHTQLSRFRSSSPARKRRTFSACSSYQRLIVPVRRQLICQQNKLRTISLDSPSLT